MSKRRVKIYTTEDVSKHNTESSCWISHDDKVYDVTAFLSDHPGGDDLILKYAGKNVDVVMNDSTEHEHSEAAYDMMSEYVIGRVGHGENLVSDDWEAPDDFHPDETNLEKDFEKNQFLELDKPLLWQLWEANFSKSYYLQQVHQPRHLAQSARLFGPDILEIFTRTTWYVVPLFWMPITANLFIRSLLQFSGPLPNFAVQPFIPLSALQSITTDALLKILPCFLFGNIMWTVLEYTLHRFLFHVDYWLPDQPVFLILHFLLHGIHHFLPMDRLRLVMPPVLFGALQYPFTRLAYMLFPAAIANGIISGAFMFYVLYDVMHYALHHTKLPQYMKEQKKYHLAHHYKNFELGFGVTSKIWDYIFNTVLFV